MSTIQPLDIEEKLNFPGNNIPSVYNLSAEEINATVSKANELVSAANNSFQAISSISAGEAGKVYDTLAIAIALDPKPADSILFQVSPATDPANAGFYSFQSSEPTGVRFEREYLDSETVVTKNLLILNSEVLNLQNPADIIDGKYVQTGTINSVIDFTGKVYFATVQPNTLYTIGGYTWPQAGMPLMLRFEDATEAKLGALELSVSGKQSFTTPAGCVKIIYSIERHDSPGNIKPYNEIMLLEGDRVADYPAAFIPYSAGATPAPKITGIDNKNIQAPEIIGGKVTEPQTGDDYVVTHAQLAGKLYVTAEDVAAEGYGVPDIVTTGSNNLQNPDDRITGQFISYTSGNYVTLAGGIMYFNTVVAGQQFTLSGYHHPNFSASQPLSLRFDNVAGVMVSFVVLPQAETPYTFTVPAGAVKVTYGVYRTSFPQDYSQIMLNAGAVALPYDVYSPQVSKVVGINGFPLDLPEETDSSDVLNLFTADKIIVPGCSYVEGGGIAVKDKNWMNKFSEMTNYQVVNFGVGGDRLVDITQRLRNNTPPFYTATGLGVKDLGGRFATVQNIGNELVNSQGVNSDLYREELKENIQAILAMGLFPVFATDFFTKNPFLTSIIRQAANEQGSYMHDVGTVGEKLLAIGVPAAQWWGTHPNVRGNSHTAAEEIYQWSRLWGVNKSIKIFRKRSAFQAATVQALNWDNFYQRSQKLVEITVGNRALSEADEATGWGFMDRANLAPSYANSATYNDEYLELMAGNAVPFTAWAAFEFIIDKIKNTEASIKLKMAENAGAKFWLKNYFNAADYAPPAKDRVSVVIPITKAVYDAANFVAGDVYTTPHVVNGSAVAVNLTVKGKIYSQATGYALCLVSATTYPTKTTGVAGTLTKVSGAGPASHNYDAIDATLSWHSYEFLAGYGKPEGSFSQIAATYADGYYTLNLSAEDLKKYVQYDNVKMIVEQAGNFTISDVAMTYKGGIDKQQKKVWFDDKLTFTEMIADNTFNASWTDAGRWTNAGGTLTSMTAAYRDYPPLIAPAVHHVALGYDAEDMPHVIKRAIILTPKAGYRKAVIRVVARLFPKLYRPDIGETTETTAVRLITPDSYDGGQLCLGIKGNNIVNVLRSQLHIGWTEHYFEVEIPPYQEGFELQLYRDPFDIVDKVNYKNHTFPLDVCFVSCQIEGE